MTPGPGQVQRSYQPDNLPRRTNTVVLSVLIGILIPLVVAAAALVVLRQGGREVVVAPITALATQTALAAATPTATATGVPPTPTGSATAVQGPLRNPTALHVDPGSCDRPATSWTWSGALNAAGYDVALYNPATGQVLARNTIAAPHFAALAVPGEEIGLMVRARSATGAALPFFAPASGIARVPARVTNPTGIAVFSAAGRLLWVWSGANGTDRFAVVRYHYAGNRVVIDQQGEVTGTSLGAAAQGSTVYYVKIRALGPCPPAGWYTPGAASAVHG